MFATAGAAVGAAFVYGAWRIYRIIEIHQYSSKIMAESINELRQEFMKNNRIVEPEPKLCLDDKPCSEHRRSPRPGSEGIMLLVMYGPCSKCGRYFYP